MASRPYDDALVRVIPQDNKGITSLMSSEAPKPPRDDPRSVRHAGPMNIIVEGNNVTLTGSRICGADEARRVAHALYSAADDLDSAERRRMLDRLDQAEARSDKIVNHIAAIHADDALFARMERRR